MLYQPATHDAPLLFQIASIDTIQGQVFSHLTGLASTAYPLANLGLFVPFSVPIPCIVKEGWVSAGTLVAGNFDIGVYNEAGTRLTSAGATAKSVASLPVNTTTMTDLTLSPDVTYYMAFSADGTNNYFATPIAAGIAEAMGVLEATSAYVLPTSVTYAKTTRAYIPWFGLNMQSVGF